MKKSSMSGFGIIFKIKSKIKEAEYKKVDGKIPFTRKKGKCVCVHLQKETQAGL
jgi:hypothetical protein